MTSDLSRRGALMASIVAAGAGSAVGASASKATAAGVSEDVGPVVAHRKVQLLDGDDQQRFLLQTNKPPLYVDGGGYERSGPLHGGYFIFNDQDQSKRGDITVDREVAQASLDWPTVDALHLGAYQTSAATGAASLSMRRMPDPAIPPDEVTSADAPERVILGTANADGRPTPPTERLAG